MGFFPIFFFNIINIRFTLVISKTKFRSGAKGLVVVGLWGLTEVLHLNYASSRQSRPKLHGSRPKLHPADRSNANFIAMSGMVAGLSAECSQVWKSAQRACAESCSSIHPIVSWPWKLQAVAHLELIEAGCGGLFKEKMIDQHVILDLMGEK